MTTTQDIHLNKGLLIALLIVGLLLYAVLPQFTALNTSFAYISGVDVKIALLALAATIASYLAAAAVYKNLSFKHLTYHRTLIIQLAAMFANRLLPAGVGGMGVNFLYLRRMRHSPQSAAAVVALNNSLGFMGHILLMFCVLTFTQTPLPEIPYESSDIFVGVTIAFFLVISILVLLPSVRQRVATFSSQTLRQVLFYRTRPSKVFTALMFSIMITASNVLCFWLSCSALGAQIDLTVAFLIFGLGIGVGIVTPTPGSLGGFEAGLIAGLVAYDIPLSHAIGAALFYRLISYWIPLVVGGVIFVYARRKRYF